MTPKGDAAEQRARDAWERQKSALGTEPVDDALIGDFAAAFAAAEHSRLLAERDAALEQATIINSELFDEKKQRSKSENLLSKAQERAKELEAAILSHVRGGSTENDNR